MSYIQMKPLQIAVFDKINKVKMGIEIFRHVALSCKTSLFDSWSDEKQYSQQQNMFNVWMLNTQKKISIGTDTK